MWVGLAAGRGGIVVAGGCGGVVVGRSRLSVRNPAELSKTGASFA
jgi:hypothetical protein